MQFAEARAVAQASFLEGGLRVPLIVRWPARVPAGRVDKTTLSSGLDWLPTVLEIAGEIEIGARSRRDGIFDAMPRLRRRRARANVRPADAVVVACCCGLLLPSCCCAAGVPELASRLPLDGRSVARAWTNPDADAARGAIFWGSVKKGRSFVRNVPKCTDHARTY